jgi:hypothetical protein
LPDQQSASSEDQQNFMLDQSEIEDLVETSNEANTEITYESNVPMTPVPVTDLEEQMSPAPDAEEGDIDIENWQEQLNSIANENRRGLQGLQIEEQGK